MKIIIMAGGKQKRYNSKTLKQLIVIDNEKDLMEHKHYDNFTMINDESTDFDTKEGLMNWLDKNKNHTCSLM